MALPDISLAQFNKIAIGEYNAGFVDFKTDDNGNVQNELTKVNNFVHRTGKNTVVLSPERILEVKEAFIEALKKGGVEEWRINEVRAQLGIPAETTLTADKTKLRDILAARFKPLTRQEVRTLLDEHAEGGKGKTDESKAAVSNLDSEAAQKTALMSNSNKAKCKSVNDDALALAERDGETTKELTDALSLLSTTRELSDLLKVQRKRCKGENAINERDMATVALQTNFAGLLKAAFKMYTSNAQESETFKLFGMDAKLVKDEENGKLSAILGTGALQTRVALGANVKEFFSRLVGRAAADHETLGAPTVKGLLNTIYNHDLESGILASDRTSLTRQFACLILEHKMKDAVKEAINLCRGNYNTGTLVEIAEYALTDNENPIDTRDKLNEYHEKLVRDNAGLPEDMKRMLEQVANIPLGVPGDEKSVFMVSEPIVADPNVVKQAVPQPPRGPAPIFHRDIGGMKAIKDFVADLVFSDDTMVADVVVNRPGESLRKALSTDEKLIALAEILKNPKVLDFAVATPIADVVKEGFAKISAILSEAYLAQSGGETLAQALGKPNGLQLFADFFRSAEKLPGEKIAQFDAIIQTMANKGCENIQSFINTVFKVNTANVNVQGAITTDPYKNMTAEQIKAELDKKTLNDILDAASTSDAPGQIGFFRQVVSTYFTSLEKADKRSCFAAAMRYADTFEFGDRQGKELESAQNAAYNKFTGAILKGTSPLLQKMMQGLPKDIMGKFADALDDMKTNLAKIPRKIVQAHLMDMIRNSNGKIKSIELVKSLGAASVGEVFLCKFKYRKLTEKTELYTDPEYGFIKTRPVRDANNQIVMEEEEEEEELVVKIMRHDAEQRVDREGRIFTEAAKKIPGMDQTWQGQFAQYKTEFDLTTEAENIKTGVELYDIKGGKNTGLVAVAPQVSSMKLFELVPPKKNALVATNAVGQTVDTYFKEQLKNVRDAASPVFECDPVTNRIRWDNGPTDPKTNKTKKIPMFKQDIPGTALANLQNWLASDYDNLQCRSGLILQATKAWFYEAIVGSGKFHGDTHSGNLMVGRNDITFIDFGNLFKLNPNRPDGVNEQQELMRVIMGAAFRDKNFVLAGFDKLLSVKGKAALTANRDKAEAILDSVLSKEKGGFAFNIVYRLQAAVVELQKLGIELPSQINCFIQSLVRLSNTLAEINTVMNQYKALLEATMTCVRPPVEVDDLDLVGKIFNVSTSKDGQKMVPNPDGFSKSKEVPAYVLTLSSEPYGGSNKMRHKTFKPGGEYYNKVLDRITKAKDPLAEVEKFAATLNAHAVRKHSTIFDLTLKGTIDEPIKKFREDWLKAGTADLKTAAINAVVKSLVSGEAKILQHMLKFGTDLPEYINKLKEPPKTFASALTDILFDNYNALSGGLKPTEKATLGLDARKVATDELGLSFWDSLNPDNVLETIIEDAKNMSDSKDGKDYKVDIGV